MPKELERKLKAVARRRGYGEERARAYVYGTLRKLGWSPRTGRAIKEMAKRVKAKG